MLWGKIIFVKYEKDGNSYKPLPGAKFTVQYVDENGDLRDIPNMPDPAVYELVDGEGNGTGIYETLIPLVDKDPTVYRITETEAPEHFVLLDGSVNYVEATLSEDDPDTQEHENIADYTLSHDYDNSKKESLLNTSGAEINLTKFTNVHAVSPNPAATTGDALFMLYQKDGDEWKIFTRNPVNINGSGQATITVTINKEYALREYQFNPNKFL